jgi:RHS repeat-associated protein
VTRTDYLTVYGGVAGNYVKVTDPALRWKIQQTNAQGQLIRVIEPNPGGGADWVTNYTYDDLGHLAGVSMPRSNGTQTRTFVYTGADLTSATNPENGTVTYQYDASHRVTKRTDAKGQETHYVYDTYGRLTQVQHWGMAWDSGINNYRFQELGAQQVNYSYDSNPLNGSYSQNAWGRLTAVQFKDENTGGSFSYMYSYNAAGRVTAQHMDYDVVSDNPLSFDAAYTWDNEGRMTGINYGPQYTLQYDANGRLGGMQEVVNGYGTPVASASYGVAGEMTGLSYGAYNPWTWSYSETRQYNSLLQMTRMTGTGTPNGSPPATVLDMQYVYTGGANNGRIVQATDWVAGETVTYGYDALNRLQTAGATNGTWGQAFTYDGFGNLTGKSVTQGSAPTLSVGYDPGTNRQYGVNYDANGNAGGGLTMYDVENRLIEVESGEQYVYDHAGKRVKKKYGTTEEYYFYGVGGQKLVTLACQIADDGSRGCPAGPKYNVYFGGKLIKSKGLMVMTDRLGSVRASVRPDWTVEQMTYYPYGEEKTSTADGREKFGTYMRDNPATDYADQRYYAVGMGRFNTADPSSAGDPTEPATWNRYSYVVGDPVNFIDRNRLFYSQAGGGDDGNDEDKDQPILGPSHFGPKTPTNPKPSPAVVRLNNAQATLSNRTSFSVDCLNDIESIAAQRDPSMRSEISINSLIDAAVGASFKNGVGSTDPTSSLYLDPTAAAAVGAGTIGTSFAANPNGLTAQSQLGTNTTVGTIIYINPTLISNSLATNEALLLHESLHLLGFDDADLQRGLGLPVDDHNTKGISTKLQRDCVTGKGNDRW